MNRKGQKHFGILAGSLALAATAALTVIVVAKTQTATPHDPALEGKIVQFVRAKFGVPDNVKMSAEPLHAASDPEFLETTITVDDGKNKNTSGVLVTKDRRYLIIGNLYKLGTDPKNEIVQHVREQFKIPAATTLSVGPYRSSPYPGLLATEITAENGGKKNSQDFYVTRDNRALVLGNVFSLGQDPKEEVLHTVVMRNQPSQGPANAPVTIVEYSDLQCPSCASFHQFLEKDLLPKYSGKVRVVFKEFPLSQIHDWSMTAAIATQCAYEIDPQAYVPFRSVIFQNQAAINASNVRDMLLNLGEQTGVDRIKLAGCLDSKSSFPRVEQGMKEGQRLNVLRTPTCFINGKMVVGIPTPDQFYKEVDEALRASK